MRVWDAFDTVFCVSCTFCFYSIVTLWCLKITHKNSFCFLRKTHYFSVTVVMAREIINVYPKNDFNIIITNQLDATYYLIVLLIGSTYFGHYYAHHQELETIMLITTLVVSFLVCCRLEVRCGLAGVVSNLQQTKNETTNVVMNIIRRSFQKFCTLRLRGQ